MSAGGPIAFLLEVAISADRIRTKNRRGSIRSNSQVLRVREVVAGRAIHLPRWSMVQFDRPMRLAEPGIRRECARTETSGVTRRAGILSHRDRPIRDVKCYFVHYGRNRSFDRRNDDAVARFIESG